MFKPKTVNFSVTEQCNSACVMCNIWKQRPLEELSDEGLKIVFSSHMFSEVRFVGISGGEISLVDNLDRKIGLICSCLEQLQEMNFIYNCIDSERTINSIQKVLNVCKENNIACNIELSFDGLKGVHDANRGVVGAFEHLMAVIAWLQEEGIRFRCDCTITKLNCSHLNSLDIFCERNNVEIKYRLASFIKRLSNVDNREQISSYTRKEKYQIVTFLMKKIRHMKRNDKQANIYRNIVEFLSKKNFKRILQCPYRKDAVYLSSNGSIYTCAPCGYQIADLTKKDSLIYIRLRLMLDRLRLKILKCNSCYHDYNANFTLLYRLKRKIFNAVDQRTKRFLLR